MKKFMRGLYLAVCYVLAAPIMVLGLIAAIIVIAVKDIIDGYGFELSYLKELVGAFAEGLRIGHIQNMQFVKYGRTYENWFSEESK